MSLDVRTVVATKAKLFRGLGDTSRLAVLEELRNGPKSVSEIVAKTGLSQPNVSGHLSFLRDCGLVEREQRGRFAYYSVGRTNVEAILGAAEALLSQVSTLGEVCGESADSTKANL
ncbi:MAG: metalloregulator ArsR/SmtB family transcription factor [Dehalococcoidia bacterium]|nr:metalloregulator ArsR/SmtB family transcription factor [Dehalococcoidia bacterium]